MTEICTIIDSSRFRYMALFSLRHTKARRHQLSLHFPHLPPDIKFLTRPPPLIISLHLREGGLPVDGFI